MDLYPKNPTIIKKLLAKRQNPSIHNLNLPSSCPINRPSSVPIIAQKLNFSSNQTSYTPSYSPAPQPQIQFNANTVIITTPKDTTCHVADQSTCAEGETTGSEDGGCGDRWTERAPNKKIKPNPESKEKRSSSFDEEVDFSTTCETCSDGNTVELSDYCSPAFTCHSHKDPIMEEFRLDDEDDGSCNQSFRFDTMSNSSDEDSVYTREVYTITSKFEGRCLSSRCQNDSIPLKFQCKYNHTWESSLGELRMRWCPKCHQNLEGLRAYAHTNGGKLISQAYSDMISFECANLHSWSVYHKNAKRKWCNRCVKDEKDKMKQRFEQERIQKQIEDEEVQKRLFEEARKKATQNMNANSYKQAFSATSVSMLEYYRKMDYEIETLAKKYTSEFMSSKEFSGQCDYQQILQVYKILIMPEEILKTYMLNLNSEALKGEFRRLAKLIHPDKNRHPKAGLAFQKIHRVYEAAATKLGASCTSN